LMRLSSQVDIEILLGTLMARIMRFSL